MNKLFYTLFIVLFSITTSNAQSSFINEWEASVGYINFQGDFGERGKFDTTLGNSGGVLGAKVYFNLLDSDRTQCYSCTHIKFNASINTGYSMLSYGTAYQEPSFTKLKSFNGQIYFVSLGLNAEYHLTDLKNINFFSSGLLNRLDPYFGIGFGGMFHNTEVESSLGNFEKDPSLVPSALKGRIQNGSSFKPMLNAEVGLRYRFDESMQFVFSNKWRYFFDDYVDGINPDPAQVDNKYNDWFFTPSLGVVIFIW